MDTWSVLETDFLAPPVVWAASSALENVAGLAVRAWGGYPQACTASVNLWLPPPGTTLQCRAAAVASHHDVCSNEDVARPSRSHHA